MKHFLILLLLPLGVVAQEGKAFQLKGNLQLQKPVEWIHFVYKSGENYVRDSVQPQNGKFNYDGKLAEPDMVELRLAYPKTEGESEAKSESIVLFLEPGKTRLKLKDTISALTVKGSKTHKAYQHLSGAQNPYREGERKLFESYKLAVKERDEATQNRLMNQRDSLEQEMLQKVNKPFLLNHTTSPVALYALTQIWGGVEDASKFEDLYNLLSPEVKALSNAVKFAEKIEVDKKTAIGKMAPDFSQLDTAGKLVSLADFRGKYVLIDFWASWCHPCREDNPNVVKIFNQYKDKGFTVLGVSLDSQEDKHKWLKAIAEDGLTWTHVSDLKEWKNEVALLFGINAIPFNLLIDPQGKIIAKDVRGEELGQVVGKAISAKTF